VPFPYLVSLQAVNLAVVGRILRQIRSSRYKPQRRQKRTNGRLPNGQPPTGPCGLINGFCRTKRSSPVANHGQGPIVKQSQRLRHSPDPKHVGYSGRRTLHMRRERIDERDSRNLLVTRGRTCSDQPGTPPSWQP